MNANSPQLKFEYNTIFEYKISFTGLYNALLTNTSQELLNKN